VISSLTTEDPSQEVFFEGFQGDRFLGELLPVYLDDSADAQQKQVVLYGGYVATTQIWREFNREWRRILKESKIEYFKTSECRMLEGQFSRFRSEVDFPSPKGREAAQQIRDRLKRVITETKPVGIAVGVLVPDYNQVLKTPDGKAFLCTNPMDSAQQAAMFECAKRVKIQAEDYCVSFIFDLSTRAAHEVDIYKLFVAGNPETAPMLCGITHQDDKKRPALQAADMMAHISHELILKKKDKTDPEFIELNTQVVGYWDKKYIEEVVLVGYKSRMKAPNPTKRW
jgi:hypothetical protein